ncbi:MAG: DUF5333 domain-containing protein [Paracoccaceae bacterium]|nr:DUF5333 domain-containing protein [Paracoccaceae bacterium]
MKISVALTITLLSVPTLAVADKAAEVNKIISQMMTDNYAARAIGSNCPSIRTVESKIGKAAMGLNKNLANQGYSRAEIRAGTKGIKIGALKAAGKQLAITKGATAGDKASYCNVGMTEISKKTYIGSVLKAK